MGQSQASDGWRTPLPGHHDGHAVNSDIDQDVERTPIPLQQGLFLSLRSLALTSIHRAQNVTRTLKHDSLRNMLRSRSCFCWIHIRWLDAAILAA